MEIVNASSFVRLPCFMILYESLQVKFSDTGSGSFLSREGQGLVVLIKKKLSKSLFMDQVVMISDKN